MKIPVEWAGDEMFAEDQSSDEFIRNYMKESKQIRIVSEYDDKKTDKSGKERKRKPAASSAGKADKKEYRKTSERRDDKKPGHTKSSDGTKQKVSAGKSGFEKKNIKKDISSDRKTERPSKNLTLDKRMDYYKERYGEDFTVKREIKAAPAKDNKKATARTQKKINEKAPVKAISLLGKIKSIFKKK